MNRKIALLLTTIVGCSILTSSCGTNSENKKQQIKIESTNVEADSSLVHPINIDSCFSVTLLQGDKKEVLNEKATKVVLSYLGSGVYDKERNKDGVKHEMTEPDFTFLLEYKDGNKTAQVWLDDALLFFDSVWYLPISAISIKDELATYSKESDLSK